jgi:hypothetical protein
MTVYVNVLAACGINQEPATASTQTLGHKTPKTRAMLDKRSS